MAFSDPKGLMTRRHYSLGVGVEFHPEADLRDLARPPGLKLSKPEVISD